MKEKVKGTFVVHIHSVHYKLFVFIIIVIIIIATIIIIITIIATDMCIYVYMYMQCVYTYRHVLRVLHVFCQPRCSFIRGSTFFSLSTQPVCCARTKDRACLVMKKCASRLINQSKYYKNKKILLKNAIKIGWRVQSFIIPRFYCLTWELKIFLWKRIIRD